MTCRACNGSGQVVLTTMAWTTAGDAGQGFWAEDVDVVDCLACEPKEEAAPGWTPETADVTPTHQEPCPF